MIEHTDTQTKAAVKTSLCCLLFVAMAMAMAMAVQAQGRGYLLRHSHGHPPPSLHLLPQILKNFQPFHSDANSDPVAVDEGQSQKKSSGGVSSSFSRMVRRIQIAYDRIRFKGLPPQLRDVAASASANAIRSESDLVNVVEQRIWHSVLEGDFEKLPGQGKPLKMEGNPHMDPAEDLAYRILYQNGFAPEWIELNKEIRFHMERWRRALRMSWKRKADSRTGDAPRREELWSADLKFLEHELNEINKKVFHYNLIVPFGRQVFRYRIEEELHRVQNAE